MTNNGEERGADVVLLVDEEGNKHEFILVDRFLVNKSDYAILVPFTENEEGENGEAFEHEEEEAFIFRIDLEKGEEMLVEVDDENEWKQVASVWEKRVQNLGYDD